MKSAFTSSLYVAKIMGSFYEKETTAKYIILFLRNGPATKKKGTLIVLCRASKNITTFHVSSYIDIHEQLDNQHSEMTMAEMLYVQ
jgi:hypothetical protein